MPVPPSPSIEFPAAAPPAGAPETVLRLLRTDPVPLVPGAAQTGRPRTRVYLDRRHLLKIRGELDFPPHDARRWVRMRVEVERRYAVHHPDKTWMLLRYGERARIANLTPLLAPLHVSLPDQPRAMAVKRLGDLVEMVLATGAAHGVLLDCGLSNFGEDRDGRLYYLDDDIYHWDRFLGLSQGLVHWFRAYPWLAGDLASDFGRRCRQLLAAYFPQPITPVAFSNHLRDLPLPGQEQRAALQRFLREVNAAPAGRRRYSAAESPAAARPPPDFADTGARPIAILADVHANLPALEAVLADMDENGFADGLLLGDLVGYGPHPKACIEAVRARRFSVLLGNHDYGVAHGDFAKGFSATGRQVAQWSAAQLDGAAKEWLSALPDTLRGSGWMAVHGAPADKSRMQAYVYRMTYEANLDYLQRQGVPWCFHGHTHLEGVWYRADRGDGFCDEASQVLSDYRFCLVCPGSVGQPRGGRGPAARYAVLYPDARRIEIRLVPYDLQRTLNDLGRYGLPASLAKRLVQGV